MEASNSWLDFSTLLQNSTKHSWDPLVNQAFSLSTPSQYLSFVYSILLVHHIIFYTTIPSHFAATASCWLWSANAARTSQSHNPENSFSTNSIHYVLWCLSKFINNCLVIMSNIFKGPYRWNLRSAYLNASKYKLVGGCYVDIYIQHREVQEIKSLYPQTKQLRSIQKTKINKHQFRTCVSYKEKQLPSYSIIFNLKSIR